MNDEVPIISTLNESMLPRELAMKHTNELFKLVAKELEVKDPDEEDLENILKANEIKDIDENTK